MMIGRVDIINDGNTVRTRNDSYSLMPNMHVSARPPFRAAGIALSAGLLGFGWAFADLAYPGERTVLAFIALAVLAVSLSLTRPTLFDRDLKHSEMATLTWGTLGHMRRKQAEIGAEIARIKRSSQNPNTEPKP